MTTTTPPRAMPPDLGKTSDAEIARREKVSREAVRQWRVKLKIPAPPVPVRIRGNRREHPDWPAEKVRALRLKNGHTQIAASIVADVHVRTWMRWETAEAPADPHVMELYEIRTA